MDSENTLAEKEYDVRNLIYSLGPMHLLHVDVGKIMKRSLSRESANGGSKLNLKHCVDMFINNRSGLTVYGNITVHIM